MNKYDKIYELSKELFDILFEDTDVTSNSLQMVLFDKLICYTDIGYLHDGLRDLIERYEEC